MAASATLRGVGMGVSHAPKLSLLWAIALAGCAAAAGSVALALTSDHVAEPGLQAALMDWMALPYVLAGVIAWWRRPDSRFGPLMVAAGFVMFLCDPLVVEPRPPSRSATRSTCCPRCSSCTCSSRSRADGSSGGSSGLCRRRVLHGVRPAARRDDARRLRRGQPARGRVRAGRAADAAPRSAGGDQRASAWSGSACSRARRRGSGRPLRRSVALLVDSLCARPGDDRRPLPVGRFRRARFRDDPASHLRGDRARADRVPDRAARRPARSLGGRRSARRVARRSATGRSSRRARPRAARSVADARVLAAAVRELGRPRRPRRCSCRAPATGARRR